MSSPIALSEVHTHSSRSFAGTRRTRTRELLCLAGIVAVFLFAEIHNARLRPFWYDELSTFFVASQSTVAGMFRAMPADGNPPLYFLLARLCLHLPLNTELSVRLPSVLAFPASAVAVFTYVRRIASFRFALLSTCVLLGSNIGDHYGVEARPYSLLMLFTALLLCLWQSAESSRHRAWILTGIAVCTSGAILSHHYGIIYALLPLATGEAIRSVRRRRLDIGLLSCLGLGSLTIFVTYPPMLRSQAVLLNVMRSSSVFWASPGWADIGWYREMQPLYIPLLFLFVAFAWVAGSALLYRRNVLPELSFCAEPEEIAVADVLVLFLPIMVLVTHLETNYFVSRYAIGSAVGIAVLVGVLASYANTRWHFIAGMVPLAILYCITIGTLSLWIAARPEPPDDHGISLFAGASGMEPIVVASALEFVPSWWYSDTPTRRRLHYLSDLQFSKTTPDMIPEYSLFLERHQTPMQMEDYTLFLRTHGSFLIYSAGVPRLEWLPPRLIQEGWSIELIASGKRGKLFRAKAPHVIQSPIEQLDRMVHVKVSDK